MSSAEPTQSANPLQVTAGEEDAGTRLDKLLAQRVDGLSRARIQALIRSGNITDAGGRPIDDSACRVKPGDTFKVVLPPPVAAEPRAEKMPLSVVYEDSDLIVIDKPAHMVVHPAPGHAEGTLVNALIAHCGESLSGIGGVRRPGIVHRLDKGTSGLLVVAKNDAAHQGLAEQFAAHGADGRMHRAYRALVWGKPLRPRDTISARLGRSQSNRTKIAVTRGEAGRHAVTHYELLKTFETAAGPVSLLRLELETGRTHQIRVHLAHVGMPVLGDSIYGSGFKAKSGRLGDGAREALEALGRQALHAAELGFEHPLTGRSLQFESPLPADMASLLNALEAD
ncbi:MAG TPA: RluA family pseudouridine synthase [Hyphomicrobium sp.]|nr:RluA family pseudouridine synthase [Hyphomicrobium sp.]